MSGQLDLFAPAIQAIIVEPTRDVIFRGAGSSEVPRHVSVPSPRPRALDDEEDWLLALDVAEAQIRWASWTQPHPLPLDGRPDSTGGHSAGNGRWADYGTKGVAVRHGFGGEYRYASWASLLKGLRKQREQEPHIADARDLAHAYSALETYDRYYVRDGGSVGGGDRDDWRERVAIPHLAKLKAIIEALGGDPTLGGRL